MSLRCPSAQTLLKYIEYTSVCTLVLPGLREYLSLPGLDQPHTRGLSHTQPTASHVVPFTAQQSLPA